MTNQETAVKTSYFSIIWNTLLAIIKWVAWYFGNSYALIADAIESTSDIFSSILVLVWIRYANKPADADHPYWHGKAEALTTFAVVAFLIVSALVIAHDSIRNIMTPHDLPKPYTLVVLGAIILWKEASFRFVLMKSKQVNSSSLRADAWHHRSDAITSVAAFIWITIALLLGKWYEAADDWAALMASGFILYNSYLIFRPALGEMMDENAHEDIVTEIRVIAHQVDWVIITEKCYVRKTWMKYLVDLHVVVDNNISVKEWHDISHRLKDTLLAKKPELANVLIHIEPYNPSYHDLDRKLS
jgi:cation diffusion facilitator family transporter